MPQKLACEQRDPRDIPYLLAMGSHSKPII